MKKILSVLLVALLALPLSAQIYRNGNTYAVDGKIMKKKDFATYMQENAEANLAMQFKSGLTISNVGWGLFAGGLGMEIIGATIMVAVPTSQAFKNLSGDIYIVDASKISNAALGGYILAAIGGGLETAGIVCLGVGYARMHNTADVYAATTNQKRQQPQAYLSLKAGNNGLGLALNF